MRNGPPAAHWQGRDLRLGLPHPARMYDFYLGGKDNYQADRAVALQVAAVYPGVFVCAREARAFMHRATRVLSRRGIRQWLDIGTGIPTQPNLHEIAQSIVPDARVVYADNDPIVLAHAQALLTSSPEGRTAYLDGDVRDPETILAAPEVTETLDLSQPVALSLNALLHFVTDDQDPYGTVNRLMAPLPSGSALTLSHSTSDLDPETMRQATQLYIDSGTSVRVRTRSEVERFFAGLELLDPGVEVTHRWRPEEEPEARAALRKIAGPTATDAEVRMWAGVALKP